MSQRIIIFSLLILCTIPLAACTSPAITPTPTELAAATDAPTILLTPTPTPTQQPTLTPTSPPPLAVLLAPAGADEAQVSALQSALYEAITSAGLRWQVRPSLSAADLTPELRLVVALPPDPGLAALAAAAPQTQFLAVGIPNLPEAPNLSQVAASGARPDQQGFIAGYIAAMLTADWRVGVISLSDTVTGKAARSGFLEGVVYFCGLCQPEYPPFYQYPLYGELPSTASAVEWQAIAGYMIDRYVQTVFVYPGAGDPAMLNTLAQAGVNLIGVGAPPEGLEQNWIASLRSESLPVVQQIIPELLAGRGALNLPMPLEITNINPNLFSPGRLRLAEETLAEMLAGFIDTGVDPITGESK